MPNKIGKYIKKKAVNCKKQELEFELFHVLQELYPSLTDDYEMALGPGIIQKDSEWYDTNYSFILSPNLKTKFIDFKIHNYNNVYNLGSHNGQSYYVFTSLESAVTNALFLAQKLELQTFTPKKLVTLKDVIFIIVLIIIVLLIIYMYYKNLSLNFS